MIKYFVVGLVAIAIWVGVGLKFYDSLEESTRAQVERRAGECFSDRGYGGVIGTPTTGSVADECGARRREWEKNEMPRRFLAGVVGFLFAFLFACVTLFVFFIRWLHRRGSATEA